MTERPAIQTFGHSALVRGRVAFTLQGDGLAPAFTDGEVIVALRGGRAAPGGRVIVELVDGRALFVRLERLSPSGEIRVSQLVGKAAASFAAADVACLSPICAMFSAGHAPRVDIVERLELDTTRGLQ